MLSGSGSSFIAASRALGSNLSAVSCWSSLSLSYLVYKKGLAYYPSGRIGWRALSSGHNGWPTAATEQGISLAFFVCSVLPLETSILLPSCPLCRPLSRAPSFLSGFTSLLSSSTPVLIHPPRSGLFCTVPFIFSVANLESSQIVSVSLKAA